jgi:hypothetical protein
VPYTQAQIDELKRIRATGALEAEFNGRHVVYRSLEEIDRIIADMERAVNGGGTYRVVSTSKGL